MAAPSTTSSRYSPRYRARPSGPATEPSFMGGPGPCARGLPCPTRRRQLPSRTFGVPSYYRDPVGGCSAPTAACIERCRRARRGRRPLVQGCVFVIAVAHASVSPQADTKSALATIPMSCRQMPREPAHERPTIADTRAAAVDIARPPSVRSFPVLLAAPSGTGGPTRPGPRRSDPWLASGCLSGHDEDATHPPSTAAHCRTRPGQAGRRAPARERQVAGRTGAP